MVSNEQRRRQLAREKYERQQQRREAARRKARLRNAAIADGLTLVLAAGATAYATGVLEGNKSDRADASDTPPRPRRSRTRAASPPPGRLPPRRGSRSRR
ncbi:hypothetical protein GCM10020000_66560 [Streptomyces olivoverticillatus]